MKFAQELDQDLVPEWRTKYLNYKSAKQHLKAVTRAINRKNDNISSIKNTPRRSKRFEEAEVNLEATTSSQHTFPKPTPQVVMFQLPEPVIVSSPIEASRQTIEEARRLNLKPLIIPGSTKELPTLDNPVPKTVIPSAIETPSRLRKMFPPGYSLTRVQTEKLAAVINPKNILRLRQVEFFDFLDSELSKVEMFYLEKEVEAGQRLAVLREQLHIMRDRREEEMAEFENRKNGSHIGQIGESFDSRTSKKAPNCSITSKLFKPAHDPETQNLIYTPVSPTHSHYRDRDYARKKQKVKDISYRTARQKLKIALQEFYRGLELLKSYALLNRTAFRKTNKKYDKTMNPNAKPRYKYMNDKVNKCKFVTSGLLDEYTEAAEDLYTRYFENGNHKLAVGKLKRLTRPREDSSESAFMNGALLGVGFTFAIAGLISGIRLLNSKDPVKREQTSLLLQIYAGYFLMLYMFAFFCLDCRIWTANKINYTFIFEFDTKHDLDWRQLSEFPSFFMLLLGGFIWLNFAEIGDPKMFRYYPVPLIFITVCLIVLPLPILRYQSRKWFVNSHYRLLFAGLFPVEFRDLVMGDMYCSLTYAMSNIALFSCLYARRWSNTPQCGSRESRILGFLVALPAIWRSFQCIRRYLDTKNAFPHLANLVKYLFVVAAAASLSLYRIDPTQFTFSLFVGVSSISAIYSSVWDIFMDFSLLQSGAQLTGLRDTMAFNQPWIYYSMLILDPLLRFGWVPLAIFTHHIQHSSVASFIVAFAEITRRGLWLLLRVENEHCSNIGKAKASRDVPLPYNLEEKKEDDRTSAEILRDAMRFSVIEGRNNGDVEAQSQEAYCTSTPLMESGEMNLKQRKQGVGFSINRIKTVKGFSRMLAKAHTEDFQKKKHPERAAKSDLKRQKGMEKELQSDQELGEIESRESHSSEEETFRQR